MIRSRFGPAVSVAEAEPASLAGVFREIEANAVPAAVLRAAANVDDRFEQPNRLASRGLEFDGELHRPCALGEVLLEKRRNHGVADPQRRVVGDRHREVDPVRPHPVDDEVCVSVGGYRADRHFGLAGRLTAAQHLDRVEGTGRIATPVAGGHGDEGDAAETPRHRLREGHAGRTSGILRSTPAART
jgi:hypothetical protein